ncbi:hypothetical protein AUR64_03545 [Haloprofundus marisrubri]|uniref:HTH bat-type domain-containing protein n=1 Tax=Haloprofundus marisrubri TaxID=1514971 RepID=A0A0W1REJ9_9EURY|nr:bacterio-opsin activator domain-containing protein [Haloprofundus marisrubri]KTG11584.1 hypothetical protein AUR64_03545 [Haloprofundus marisrubri]
MRETGPMTSFDKITDVFTQLPDPYEPLTSAEVADSIGCARRTALKKLVAMVKEGLLRSKKVGASGRVFWKPPKGTVSRETAAVGADAQIVATPTWEFVFRSAKIAKPLLDAGSEDTEVVVDGIVRLDGETHLQYWNASGISPKDLLEIEQHYSTNLGGRLLSTHADSCRVEVVGSNDSLLAIFEELGGRLKSAVIKDGTITIDAALPYSVDPSSILDSVEDIYPDLELVSKRLVYTPRLFRQLIEDVLSPRQWIALQSAYYAGYFSTPKTSTGEQIAASMGITKQTFHEHLRSAEETVITCMLRGDENPNPD